MTPVAITRSDLITTIKGMPPRSRGRQALEELNRKLTTEELIGEACVKAVAQALEREFCA